MLWIGGAILVLAIVIVIVRWHEKKLPGGGRPW